MSMSTYIIGFKPPDEKFKKMLKAYRACESAGVPIPEEVENFFEGEPPDENGVKVDLGSVRRGGVTNGVKPYRDDSREGIEVNLDELPKDIKILRFVNSW